MAVRNAARYLGEALDSVMAQTLSDLEIVMVDGHSSDETAGIAGRYPGIRFLQQTGDGFAGAWNDGVSAAQGKFIALLDSDDRWMPDKLSRQVDVLDRDPAVMGVIGKVRFFVDPGAVPPPGFRKELLERDHVAYMPGALLARRSLFETVGPFDTAWRIASDIDWFARLKEMDCCLAVLPDVVIHKRVHATNLSYTTARTPAIQEEVLLLLRNSIRRRSAGRTPQVSSRSEAPRQPTPQGRTVLRPQSPEGEPDHRNP